MKHVHLLMAFYGQQLAARICEVKGSCQVFVQALEKSRTNHQADSGCEADSSV